MCVNNLVALDSAAAGIEPAISSRRSNALTTAPPSHTLIGGGAALFLYSVSVVTSVGVWSFCRQNF